MIRYASTTRIERPPAQVFTALLDPARYAEWTDMTDMTFDPGPPRVGMRGHFRLPSGPIKGSLELELVELEPDRRVVYRISHPSLTWIARSETLPDGDGTRFVYAGEVSLRGWRRLLEPIARGEIARGEANEAQRFKSLLEREATSPAATT